MIERIEQLRAQAEMEISAARAGEALEELRVRHLGRKAELPQMLRGVGQLEPQQRGAVGKAANEARQALEALIEARATQLGGEELQGRLHSDRVDVTLPGAPPQPLGRLHLLTAMRRDLEDIFLGLGFTVMEGPEVESVHYNFDALNHSPTHPARARTDTFYVASALGAEAPSAADGAPPPSPGPPRSGAGRSSIGRGGGAGVENAHLADAGARDGGSSATALCGHSRPRVQARLGRHPHTPVPSDRGSGGGRGHHARRPQGDAAGVRPRGLR
jgi:phenylalanyl-tRNA synthetase alpha subunit